MEKQPRLPCYERLAACLIISFLAFLGFFNLWIAEPELPKTGTPYTPKQPLIEVIVEGAVQNPGIYRVKKGTIVQEVLELAHPLEVANLKRIKLDNKILRRRTIKVQSEKKAD